MCSYLYFYSSCHSCSTIGNQDFLKLAVEDFNICQSIQREELKHIERCVKLWTMTWWPSLNIHREQDILSTKLALLHSPPFVSFPFQDGIAAFAGATHH
jgi:hypothetical protein